MYFTNVRLLKDLEIESRKQNKVKNRLLLLLRCLSVIFLVLLFAGPYIKNEDKAIGFYNDEELEDGSYEVGNICIIPEYQGKGIGKELLKRVTDHYDDYLRIVENLNDEMEENINNILDDGFISNYIDLRGIQFTLQRYKFFFKQSLPITALLFTKCRIHLYISA